MKETYTEKFVGLDFSQNISLRPKDEVQSAHPSEMRYHDHLSELMSLVSGYFVPTELQVIDGMAIDRMPSFGVKNILRKDIVTCDFF